MRSLALVLAFAAALCLGACGDSEESTTSGGGNADNGNADSAGGGIALAGGGWDGGAGLDPTKSSDKVRVVAFFKPG